MLLLTSLFLPGVQAGQLDHWHWRSPTPFANSLHSVAFGAGKFVAVSDGGVIHLSADGVVWDDGHRLIADPLYSVIYANSQFVAVGDNGAIVTSPDGFTWTKRNSGVTNSWLTVTYGNGKYLACGRAGQIAFSPDGITWSPGFFGANDITWAAAGNGVFILPGGTLTTTSNYQAYVEVSSDGVTWNPAIVFTTTLAPWINVNEVTFADGPFVALVVTVYGDRPVASQPQEQFFSSTDGRNWSQGALVDFGHFQPSFMTYANGAVWMEYFSTLVKTVDGSAFSMNSAPSANGFAYGNGNYVMVGNGSEVLTSASGTNWTAQYLAVPYNFDLMVLGPNGYLAGSHGGPIFNSTDGLTFKALPSSPVLGYTDIAYDGSNVVAVAEGGTLYTSADGISWTQRNSNSGGNSLRGVARGAARWVAVGDGGTIITSPSGSAWTLHFSGTANSLRGGGKSEQPLAS